ncbi:MAG: TIGR00366 family protein [Chitinophagales bacterium]|nr:short-chain fatty acid transporter [Bacteroidota bacterium]
MSFSTKYIATVQRYVPSPFSIAIILSIIIGFAAFFWAPNPQNFGLQQRGFSIFLAWEKGFWDLLAFSMQMVLILVLGHICALTNAVNKLMQWLLGFFTNNATTALGVCLISLVFAWINWGLGLIVGAILARKAAENARAKNIAINYPLIGAAAYTAMMVWHGGLSGSAPLTIATEHHALVDKIGVIPVSDTIFSPMNLFVSVLLLFVIPFLSYWFAKTLPTAPVHLYLSEESDYLPESNSNAKKNTPAESLENSRWFSLSMGSVILAIGFYKAYVAGNLSVLSLNYINFMLLGLGLCLHHSVYQFLLAGEKAVKGAWGIIIQFPFYAGIMGIMQYTGLIVVFSDFFVNISNTYSFPIFTYLSAGIVNLFVPSGGGQWAVQGPIIVNAAQLLQADLPKSVMALAYGDQLTNMLQPFWALPLLAITGLRASDILPYCILFFIAGFLIFFLALLAF